MRSWTRIVRVSCCCSSECSEDIFFFFVYSTPHLGNECERNIQLVLSAEWIKFTMQVAAHFGAADHSFCVSMTMQLSFAVMSPYSPLPLTTSIQSVIFCRRIYAYYSCRSIEMERRNLNRQILCSVNAEEFPFRWETLSSIHFFFFCRTSFRMTNTYWCGVLHPTTARDRSIEQQTASEQIIIALGKYEICSNEAACDRRWINCIHFGGRSFGPHTAASLVFSFTRLNALNIDRGHGIWHGPGVDVGGSRQGQMPRSNALIHCSWYSYFCVCVAGCVFENMKIWITVLEKFEKYSDALLSNVAVATTVLANRPNQNQSSSIYNIIRCSQAAANRGAYEELRNWHGTVATRTGHTPQKTHHAQLARSKCLCMF